MALVLGYVAVALLFVALCLTANWLRSFRSPFETTTAKIFETRRVVVGKIGSQQGGGIVYEAEAHVQYLTVGISRIVGQKRQTI